MTVARVRHAVVIALGIAAMFLIAAQLPAWIGWFFVVILAVGLVGGAISRRGGRRR